MFIQAFSPFLFSFLVFPSLQRLWGRYEWMMTNAISFVHIFLSPATTEDVTFSIFFFFFQTLNCYCDVFSLPWNIRLTRYLALTCIEPGYMLNKKKFFFCVGKNLKLRLVNFLVLSDLFISWCKAFEVLAFIHSVTWICRKIGSLLIYMFFI